MKPHLTLYYDQRCPVCRHWMASQQRRLGSVVAWEDINRQPLTLAEYGVDSVAIRRRLHAVDSDGRLYQGFAAVVALWRLSAVQGWRGWLLDHPHWLAFLGWGYERCLAPALYHWGSRCPACRRSEDS